MYNMKMVIALKNNILVGETKDQINGLASDPDAQDNGGEPSTQNMRKI
jgi:hypothetical protein